MTYHHPQQVLGCNAFPAAQAVVKNNLQEHEVYRFMTRYLSLRSVPKRNKSISSRFVFKQKADNLFDTRLLVQDYVQEPGIGYR